MNIAAYMAALKVTDLDHTAKHALQVVCGHCNQRSGVAWVTVTRIASDMGVHRVTALHALQRVVEAGYLTVEKSPGNRPQWTQKLSTGAWGVAERNTPPVAERNKGVAERNKGVAERNTKDPLDTQDCEHARTLTRGERACSPETETPAPRQLSPDEAEWPAWYRAEMDARAARAETRAAESQRGDLAEQQRKRDWAARRQAAELAASIAGHPAHKERNGDRP